MQHRSKHNSIIWAWRNRANWNFSLIFIGSIQYFIAELAVFWHISTKSNGLSCLTGLLSGPCSFLLPDVQTWICTVHTQDLKPTVLPQYIDEMRSRSGMAKKKHSHSPPFFFFPGAPFLGSKMGSEMVSSTLTKIIKIIFLKKKSSCWNQSMSEKKWGNPRPRKIHQHEANQKNTAKIKATLQRALHDIPRHFSMGGGHR